MKHLTAIERLLRQSIICSIISVLLFITSFLAYLIYVKSLELTPDPHETLAAKFLFLLPVNLISLILSWYSLKLTIQYKGARHTRQIVAVILSTLVIEAFAIIWLF